MSINHISTDLQETPWWQQHPEQLRQSMMEMETTQSSTNSSSSATTPQQQQQFSSWRSPHHHQLHHHHQQQQQRQLWLNSYNNNNSNSHHDPILGFSLNNQHDATDEQPIMTNTNSNQEQELGKEPMFEKPLTPSDVGKLNRLVIPKQHAEKYFPLGGGADSGSSSDKGLLLTFQDESGKYWSFRYSYWNSSQSYVLTKGWSRYVKEKRLDAGDVILFERHRTDSEKLFIGWRRRGAAAAAQDAQSAGAAAGGGGSSGWPRGFYSNHPYPVDVVQGHGVSVPLYHHAGSGVQSQTTSVGSSRTLRLFGVNLECQLDDESEGSESQAQAQAQAQGLHQFNYSMEAYNSNSTNRHNHHMDITFSQEDVNQMMRNRQG